MSETVDFSSAREVQRKARQGEPGQLRKEFYRQYRELLEGCYADIRSDVAGYTASSGESVSCVKGCSHCCEHFVSVTVSHSLVITDYLYTSENAMSAFMRGYPRWLAAVQGDPAAKAVFTMLEQDTALSADVKRSSEELRTAYHRYAIPCPFLEGKRCAIYAVRPLCCAGFFSMASPEFCRADNEILVPLVQVVPSKAKLKKLAELTDIRLSAHQEALPTLVYKLLTRGFQDVYLEVENLFKPQGGPPQPGNPD